MRLSFVSAALWAQALAFVSAGPPIAVGWAIVQQSEAHELEKL